jgi:hypothetical protein
LKFACLSLCSLRQDFFFLGRMELVFLHYLVDAAFSLQSHLRDQCAISSAVILQVFHGIDMNISCHLLLEHTSKYITLFSFRLSFKSK